VIQLAADGWLLDQLLAFDAGSEDLAHEGEADEIPAVLGFDRASPRQVYRGRQYDRGAVRSESPAIGDMQQPAQSKGIARSRAGRTRSR